MNLLTLGTDTGRHQDRKGKRVSSCSLRSVRVGSPGAGSPLGRRADDSYKSGSATSGTSWTSKSFFSKQVAPRIISQADIFLDCHAMIIIQSDRSTGTTQVRQQRTALKLLAWSEQGRTSNTTSLTHIVGNSAQVSWVYASPVRRSGSSSDFTMNDSSPS